MRPRSINLDFMRFTTPADIKVKNTSKRQARAAVAACKATVLLSIKFSKEKWVPNTAARNKRSARGHNAAGEGELSLFREFCSSFVVVKVLVVGLTAMIVVRRFEVWTMREFVSDYVVREHFWLETDRRFDEEEHVTIWGLSTSEEAFSGCANRDRIRNRVTNIGVSCHIGKSFTNRRLNLTLLVWLRWWYIFNSMQMITRSTVWTWRLQTKQTQWGCIQKGECKGHDGKKWCGKVNVFVWLW